MLNWQGESYTQAGVFADTVSLSGCLTALSVDVTILAPDTILRAVQLCAGEGYVFGGDTLFVPGAYSHILQTSAGCDST